MRRPSLSLIVLAVVIAAVAIGRLTSSEDSAGVQPPQAITKARELLVAVDNAELCHWQRHGRYGNLPDLDETMEAMAPDHLTGSLMGMASFERLDLELHVSRGGKSYMQHITGRGVNTYVERRGADFVDYGADGWSRLHQRCATR